MRYAILAVATFVAMIVAGGCAGVSPPLSGDTPVSRPDVRRTAANSADDVVEPLQVFVDGDGEAVDLSTLTAEQRVALAAELSGNVTPDVRVERAVVKLNEKFSAGRRGARLGAAPEVVVKPTDDVAAKARAAPDGATVILSAGTYNWSMVRLPGKRIYKGVPWQTIIKGSGQYAVIVEGNASDALFTYLVFDGAGVDMGAGGKYTNIDFLSCWFRNMDGSHIPISIRSGNTATNVDNNWWTNLEHYGAVEWYNPEGSASMNGNWFRNIRHGGHILGPRDNFSFSRNTGAKVKAMLVEIQRSGNSVSQNMKVEDNVIYDYADAYGASYGYSVIAEGGLNTSFRNNYADATHASNVPLREGHMAPGAELGYDSGICEGNIFGGNGVNGNYVCWIATAGKNMLLKNNRGFGRPMWAPAVMTWPGYLGSGSYREEGNSWSTDYGQMPPPPRRVPETPPVPGVVPPPIDPPPIDPPPPPTTIPGVQNLKGTPANSREMKVTWSNVPAGTTKLRVTVAASGDTGNAAKRVIVDLPTTATTYDFDARNLQHVKDTGEATRNWKFDIRVESTTSAGVGVATATAQMLTTDPVIVLPPPPPPPPVTQPTDDPFIGGTLRYKSGKTTEVVPK